MVIVQDSPVVRYVRQLAAASLTADLSDAQLLERFAAQRDEAAFTLLVRRHGPLVLGVCRRVLGDWHLAQDCFQVTFLLLAQKAGSLRQPDALAAWLYGVAARTARKARTQAIRRRQKEEQVRTTEAVEDPDDPVWRDLRPVLDESVNGLPERYRVPFVLHYVQGVTVSEVARRLGCPRGSIATRLARARERLRARLVRRGVALSAGCLAAVLSEVAGSASVPAALVVPTVRTAVRMAAGQAVEPGLLSAPAAALSEGVLRTMSMTRIKLGVGVLLLLALLGAGAEAISRRPHAADKTDAKKEEPPPAKTRRPDASFDRRFRFLSLAEARAIALDQKQLHRPTGLESMLQAPPDERLVSAFKRLLAGTEGLVLTGLPPKVSRAEFERHVNQVLLNVETAYWNLYGSYWQVYSREQGLRLARESWEIVDAKYRTGRANKAEYAEARGQYELFRHQRLQAIDVKQDSERQLRAIIGLPIEDGVELVPSDAPTLVEKHPDFKETLAEALRQRPELHITREEIKAAEGDQEQLDRAHLLLQDLEMKTERFLGRELRRMSSGYAQIKAAHAQREAFATQLRTRTKDYQASRAARDLLLLLEAQRFMADSLYTECQAVVTYNNALCAFEYAKGSIMTHAHVTFAEKPPAGAKAWDASRERKRTQTQVRRVEGVPADWPATGTATSLPALWKTIPPMVDPEPLPMP